MTPPEPRPFGSWPSPCPRRTWPRRPCACPRPRWATTARSTGSKAAPAKGDGPSWCVGRPVARSPTSPPPPSTCAVGCTNTEAGPTPSLPARPEPRCSSSTSPIRPSTASVRVSRPPGWPARRAGGSGTSSSESRPPEAARGRRAGTGRERTREPARGHQSGQRTIEPLVRGADFYASPTPSPDGRRLAWLSWNHPTCPGTRPRCRWLTSTTTAAPVRPGTWPATPAARPSNRRSGRTERSGSYMRAPAF